MDLNSILNWAVPLCIFLAFFGIFYSQPKIKAAVNAVFRGIGKAFSWATGKAKEKGEQSFDTVYKYG